MNKLKIPTAISIFTGIGGMDIGAKAAGVQILAGADRQEFTAIVHNDNTRENNPGAPSHIHSQGIFLSGEMGDVYNLDGSELLALINDAYNLNYRQGEVDMMFGGPPCQAFSLSNRKRSPFDKRAVLIFQMLRLTRQIMPKVVVIEQVPQILSRTMLPIWNKVCIALDNMDNYYWSHKVLNAMNYGGRQNRNRRIFMLVRKDLGKMPSFPAPSEPDMTKVSAHVLLPHISHYSSGQGGDKINRTENRVFSTITASGCEWVYESGVRRKLHLNEKKILTETEGLNLGGLSSRQQNIGLGNMVQPSLMRAIVAHVQENILKS